MERTLDDLKVFNKQEPIPGYFTKELLGSGGYGEVWKCLAPGGLFKAVKIISSGASSSRATGELRSLNRIKEVRHPFLLSIERIEVVDGNVIVVTELADQSLKRQYQKHCAKGLFGIPRGELLAYLRDVAEALDFIYDNYSLQHLDIKPENILLLGNRAKLADFGMIKNLYDRSTSAVEGLTPVYAPPELFEGKPNRHSDQYSLAIVFQEMLSGRLPFDGATAAQLAAQHLHMAPNLSGIPKADQPIVARALSKDPSQRFPTCRVLIDALDVAGKSTAYRSYDTANGCNWSFPPQGNGPCPTQEIDRANLKMCESESGASLGKSVAALPEIDFNDQGDCRYEPVLFVGIGGTGTRVLRRLRRRLSDRLGPLDAIPAIDMLLIDTDIKSLNRATDGDSGSAIGGEQRLPMPLRRSEDYRATASHLLTSISRRWLFNVPYSLETAGFRPLGRLALLDHSKRLLERIRQSLLKITGDENVEKASSTTGLKFSSRQPKVFIVASTAGGTGSGMVIDVAYAVRAVLAKLDLPDGNVHGILMHSTPRGPRERDSAIANSYATLSELWHYSRPGKCYPGDRSCGLPAFHGNNRTFASCYFVHLGDELTELQFDVATDPVAEYLYTSSVTPAAEFLDKSRQMEYVRWGTELHEPVVRTFGLNQFGASNSEMPSLVAELICRDLVHRWRGGITDTVQTAALPTITASLSVSNNDLDSPIRSQASLKADEAGVQFEAMRVAARAILDEELSSNADDYFHRFIETVKQAENANGYANAVATIDSLLTSADDATVSSVGIALNTRLEARAAKMAEGIREWVLDLIDQACGVSGAQQAAEWFQSHLRELHIIAVETAERLREDALTLQHGLLRSPIEVRRTAIKLWGSNRQQLDRSRLLHAYAMVQCDQAVACAVARWIRLVEARVNVELERLHTFWKDFTALADKFQVSKSLEEAFDSRGDADSMPGHWHDIFIELMRQRLELIATLDHEVEKSLGLGPKKLKWHLNEGRPIDVQLVTPLRAAARQLILATMQQFNLSLLSAVGNTQENQVDYRGCIEAARPPLAELASGTRAVLMVPKDMELNRVHNRLAAEVDRPVTVIPSSGGDLIACQECELLEVRNVAAHLIGERREFIEVARRLHTRTDVAWDSLAGRPSRNIPVDDPAESRQEIHTAGEARQ